MAVKLVALDIDGTIVGEGEASPSPEVTEAIDAVSAAGVAVVLASGRMFPGTAAMAKQLGLGTPVICQQGCSVHELSGAMIEHFPLTRPAALDVVDYAKSLALPYEWFNAIRYLVSEKTADAVEYGELSGVVPEFGGSPENSGIEPTGVGIISSHEQANSIHRALVDKFRDQLYVLDFPRVTVAVSPEANKGHALSLVAGRLGIDRHDVAAVGDSVNDASMLAWASRGYSMAHADRYAADAADESLPAHPSALPMLLRSLTGTNRTP